MEKIALAMALIFTSPFSVLDFLLETNLLKVFESLYISILIFFKISFRVFMFCKFLLSSSLIVFHVRLIFVYIALFESIFV